MSRTLSLVSETVCEMSDQNHLKILVVQIQLCHPSAYLRKMANEDLGTNLPYTLKENQRKKIKQSINDDTSTVILSIKRKLYIIIVQS